MTAALALLPALPLAGQATADTGFCTATPSAVTSMVVEYSRGLMDVQSTLLLPIPAAVASQIATGQKELRDRITFDAASGVFKSISFLATPGSTMPTPATVDLTSATIFSMDVAIEKVYTTCAPYASFMFRGTVLKGVEFAGDPKGAPYIFTAGYTLSPASNSRVFRDIESVVAGFSYLYHNFGAGTISVALWAGDAPVFYPNGR